MFWQLFEDGGPDIKQYETATTKLTQKENLHHLKMVHNYFQSGTYIFLLFFLILVFC